MKAAIFINDGLTQVVLTPENDWEKNALQMIANSAGQDAKTFWAKFYECQGGWLREGRAIYETSQWRSSDEVLDGSSLIFRIDKKMPIPEQAND